MLSYCSKTLPPSLILCSSIWHWQSCFKRQIPKSIPVSVTLKKKFHWSYNIQHRPLIAVTYEEKRTKTSPNNKKQQPKEIVSYSFSGKTTDGTPLIRNGYKYNLE